MKWTSHKLLTAVTVYLLTKEVGYVIPAVVGSIFPDAIEGRPPMDKYSREYKSWRKSHRQGSHWFVIYLALIGVLYGGCQYTLNHRTDLIASFGGVSSFKILVNIIIFFLVGCVMHIIQDAICGKVPSLNPRKKIGLKLFKVGSLGEYIIVYSLIFIATFSIIRNIY